MKQRHNHKKAFSLIEAAIVLGVVGLVIGGIWVAASAVMENNRINRASAATILMVGNARRLIGKNADAMMEQLGQHHEHNLADMMVSAGAVPTDLVSNGHLKTPWDTEMRFYIGDMGGGALPTPYIAVTYMDMTRSVCRKLVLAIANHFHDRTELTYIYIGGGSLEATYTAFPIPVTTPSLCDSNASGGKIDMLSFFFNPT